MQSDEFEFCGRSKALKKQRFTKKDWTLFRNKIANWQEVYMDRLNKEYIDLLSKEDVYPSEKFWRLDKRIKEDRKKTGVQLEMRRSDLIYSIISLINDGAINFEDLEEFSDELKESVRVFIERQFRFYEVLSWNLDRNIQTPVCKDVCGNKQGCLFPYEQNPGLSAVNQTSIYKSCHAIIDIAINQKMK